MWPIPRPHKHFIHVPIPAGILSDADIVSVRLDCEAEPSEPNFAGSGFIVLLLSAGIPVVF